MDKNKYITIKNAVFDNYNEDCFFFEIPSMDLSNANSWHHPFLLYDGTNIYSILRGADKSKLRFAYCYIHQSKKSGQFFFNISLTDKIIQKYNCKKISTKDEFETLKEQLKQKVKLLNKEYSQDVLPLDEFIKKNINSLNNTRDLAFFLTKIMKVIFSENHFVTENQLKYFCSPNIPNRYKTFKIQKKSGGLREINAPTNRLNKILCALNIVFKTIYTPHNAVSGFTQGKSIADNAIKHIGQNYVFNIDLKDFFTSIPQKRIWGRLHVHPFNLRGQVANVVAGLCCCKNSETGENVLPQGAPTSPLLTNAVCDKLDKQLFKLSKKYGLHYSRYADDITFSSMHNVYQEDSDFRRELKIIIEGQNFCINDKKTRLLRSGQRQEVTGLIVNSKTNVTRKYVRDLRYILHVWETKGYAVAYSIFYRFYKKEKGYIKKGEPVMENVIGGKLNYLRMIKGTSNECYQKLAQQFDRLQQIIYVDEDTDNSKQYVFVQSYTINEFEHLFNTKITLQISARKKLVGKCELYGSEKIIPISHLTQDELCPEITKFHVGDIVKNEKLDFFYITLCRQKGKNFWLIINKELIRSRCLSINDIIIDTENFFHLWETEGFIIVVKLFQFVLNKYGNFDTEKVVNFINDLSKRNEISKKKRLTKKRKLQIEEALKDDSFKKIKETEIQEFVYFITHYKQFTYKQKMYVNRLLTRDLATKYIEKTEIVIDDGKHRCGVRCEYISPKKLQKFLFDFNQDEVLKYTCHPIDSEEVIEEINKQCKTDIYSVEAHSKLILERFESKFKNVKSSRNMQGLIFAYLKGPKEWSSNRVVINWSSNELISWSNENKGKIASPGKNIAAKQKNYGFKLPNPFVSSINGQRVATFTNLVIFFKTLFHIRRDNSLKNIITYNNKSIENVNITFSSNFNENIELFTDVDKLLQAYKNIIKICTDCSLEGEQPVFEISFYKEENNVYFCIHHINTKYGKTLDDSLKRIGESQSNLIKNQINGLCDLFIEADFGNKEYARINLWDESDELKAQNIAEMQGVKYILRF